MKKISFISILLIVFITIIYVDYIPSDRSRFHEITGLEYIPEKITLLKHGVSEHRILWMILQCEDPNQVNVYFKNYRKADSKYEVNFQIIPKEFKNYIKKNIIYKSDARKGKITYYYVDKNTIYFWMLAME